MRYGETKTPFVVQLTTDDACKKGLLKERIFLSVPLESFGNCLKGETSYECDQSDALLAGVHYRS
jgi:hypothetical protein